MKVKRNPIMGITRQPLPIIKRNSVSSRGSRMGKKDQLKNINLPGQNFMDNITPGDTPREPGVYMIFYQYDPPTAHSKIAQQVGPGIAHFSGDFWSMIRTAGVSFANYFDGKWGFNYKVLAYMGPMPTLNLKALKEYKPGYPVNQTFYITTMELVTRGKALSGPHGEFMLAFLQKGNKGEFIISNDSEDGVKFISKYDPDSDGISKWVTLSEKESTKYRCEMRSLL